MASIALFVTRLLAPLVLLAFPVYSSGVPPVFQSTPYTALGIDEDVTAAVANHFTFSITDAESDALTVSIVPPTAPFVVAGAGGAIYQLGYTASPNFDFEATPSYTLNIQCNDGSNIVTETITVPIDNVNESPFYTGHPFTAPVSIAETATAANNAFYLVTVSDPEGTVPTLSITGVTPPAPGVFSINGLNIAYAANPGFDFETTPQFVLTISATDGSLAVATTVTINIGNVNEPPVYTKAVYAAGTDTANIAESETAASAMYFNIPVSDQDTADTLTLTITPNTGHPFTINESPAGTFYLSYPATPGFDFETTPTYSLTINADDGTNAIVTCTVNIQITDVNEAPIFTSTAPFLGNGIAETVTAADTTYFAVPVSDPEGDTMTLSIDSVAPASAVFTPNGLNIAYTANPAFDFETNPSYVISFTIRDTSGNSISSTLTANIVNVNEAPFWTVGSVPDSTTSFNIDEDQTAGAITTLVGEDNDAGDVVKYRITAVKKQDLTVITNLANDFFVIDQATGALTYAGAGFDTFAETPLYYIDVECFDGTGDVDTATLTITINPIDEPLVYSLEPYLASINELDNAAPLTLNSIVVTASDPEGQTMVFTVSQVQGVDSGGGKTTVTVPFSVDGATNKLITTAAYTWDYETYVSYEVTISGTSVGSALPAVDSVAVVSIVDQNEPPTWVVGATPDTTSVFNIDEDISANAFFATLAAEDVDNADTQTYSITKVSLTDGTDITASHPFTIDSSTGQVGYTISGIPAISPFNYEIENAYFIDVRCTDSGTLTVDGQLQIDIVDKNDKPVIGNLPDTAYAMQIEVADRLVFTIECTDEDQGTYQNALTFTYTANPATNMFYFVTNTGNNLYGDLRVRAGTFPFETEPQYLLTVTVDDGYDTVDQMLTVIIHDVNQNPNSGTLTYSVIEHSGANVKIFSDLSKIWTDPDFTTTTYEILTQTSPDCFELSGTPQTWFQTTGRCIFDYEMLTQHVVTVRIKDSSDAALQATGTIRVNVVDVNENPVFVDLPKTINVEAQTNAVEKHLHEVVATSPDQTYVTYYIDSVTPVLAENKFRVSSTGHVYLKPQQPLDLGISYTIAVKAISAKGAETISNLVIAAILTTTSTTTTTTTTTTVTYTTAPPPPPAGLSIAAIIGIIAGCLVALALMGVAAYFIWNHVNGSGAFGNVEADDMVSKYTNNNNYHNVRQVSPYSFA